MPEHRSTVAVDKLDYIRKNVLLQKRFKSVILGQNEAFEGRMNAFIRHD